MIGPAIPAGTPDSGGEDHATIAYQGLTDGVQHQYRFYSIGITAPATRRRPTSRRAMRSSPRPSLRQPRSRRQLSPWSTRAAERSYIRYLDIGFNESDGQSGGQLAQVVGSVATASPLIQLYKFDLNGTPSSKTPVSLRSPAVLKVIDHAIEIDFGAAGIGEVVGGNNTTAADGYYELDVTVGSTTYKHDFYRLLGDVTGDRVVDNHDLTAIATALAPTPRRRDTRR